MQFFENFSRQSWLLLIATLIILKLILFVFFKDFLLGLAGGGNDSNYYHAVAIGNSFVRNEFNLWGYYLYLLNTLGLYNRELLALVFFSMSISLLPILYYKIIFYEKRSKAGIFSFFIMVFYPTVFFYSFDIYRDVFLLVLTLLSLYFFKKYLESRFLWSFFYLLFFLLIAYIAVYLRIYLGASLFIAFIIYALINKFNVRLYFLLFSYFISVVVFYALGFFDAITLYRGIDGFESGGSTLGVGLYGKDPVTFLLLYSYSFLMQAMGFFLVNPSAYIMFITESFFFILALFYILKNPKFVKGFVLFLIIFFVTYTTFWVMGNDNLGTSLRLRMPSYSAIIAAALIIHQTKLRLLYRNV